MKVKHTTYIILLLLFLFILFISFYFNKEGITYTQYLARAPSSTRDNYASYKFNGTTDQIIDQCKFKCTERVECKGMMINNNWCHIRKSLDPTKLVPSSIYKTYMKV